MNSSYDLLIKELDRLQERKKGFLFFIPYFETVVLFLLKSTLEEIVNEENSKEKLKEILNKFKKIPISKCDLKDVIPFFGALYVDLWKKNIVSRPISDFFNNLMGSLLPDTYRFLSRREESFTIIRTEKPKNTITIKAAAGDQKERRFPIGRETLILFLDARNTTINTDILPSKTRSISHLVYEAESDRPGILLFRELTLGSTALFLRKDIVFFFVSEVGNVPAAKIRPFISFYLGYKEGAHRFLIPLHESDWGSLGRRKTFFAVKMLPVC